MMTVAAAPLGALAICTLPIGLALGIDVITAILGVLPLMLFAIPQNRMAAHERLGVWREFEDGILVVWENPTLRRLYGLMAAVVLVIMPSFALVPLLVTVQFSGCAEQVAIIEDLAGVGMIAGGMIVAAMAPRRRVLWVIPGFAASCATMTLAALAPGHMFWLAVAFWIVSSVTFVFGNAPLMTIIQTSIPNQMQGRALSLLTTVMALAAPVDLAIATPLGEAIGIRWLFVVMGFSGAAISLLGLTSPTLRRAEQHP